jgi:hypothetical protein
VGKTFSALICQAFSKKNPIYLKTSKDLYCYEEPNSDWTAAKNQVKAQV